MSETEPLSAGSGPDKGRLGDPIAQRREALEAGLYLVATPIGNAADITLRALDILARAHVLACEDTRTTAKLMSLHGLRPSMIPYHEHNADAMRPRLIERMARGEAVALVSDAGTPLVSDPGYKLVREALEAGLRVTTAPGASAPLAALALSGLPSDRFFFAGFPPSRPAARLRFYEGLAPVPGSLILFESARRLAGSLADAATALGPRPAAVARELTKRFEEVRRGRLDALARHYEDSGPPKGEITLVIGPPEETPPPDSEDLDAMIEDAMRRMSRRDAVAHIAAETGLPKRAIYARALALDPPES